MEQVKIGRFIAALRKEKHLTQEKLGDKLRVTNKTISRWENGTYMPDIEMLQLLSKEFEVSINELLAGERIPADKLREKTEENIVEVLKLIETKSIIGAKEYEKVAYLSKDDSAIHDTNNRYWTTKANSFLGAINLPKYGAFLSEDKLGLFNDVKGKTLLEIGCGNGMSLNYMRERGAGELWGLDISHEQIKRAQEKLGEHAQNVKFVCAPMEDESGIPKNYFDYVYSIYGIGWSVDLDATFNRIAEYLKKDGVFIFSWSHPIHKCLAYDKGKMTLRKSYFDESWYSVELDEGKINLSDRKLSTFINALAKAGFVVEELVEDSDQETIREHEGSDFSKKAEMVPVTFVIKARKGK